MACLLEYDLFLQLHQNRVNKHVFFRKVVLLIGICIHIHTYTTKEKLGIIKKTTDLDGTRDFQLFLLTSFDITLCTKNNF